MIKKEQIKKISDLIWEIPAETKPGMLVAARFFADEEMIDEITRDMSLGQLANVATLSGIVKYSLAMPDIHEGYGFPIGGVAAFDFKKGIISPGGVGYDINCGVRLLRSEKSKEEISIFLNKLSEEIYKRVPSGVGRGGKIKLNGNELKEVLERGAEYVIKRGFGEDEDLANIESNGRMENASAKCVSDHAKSRGKDQLGTLGAGNHFIEVGEVEKIFDEKNAKRLNIFKRQIVVLIHTGSRGLGHQIATDYIKIMLDFAFKNNIKLIDRELAYAPFHSSEGQAYLKAMSAGANFAWANRQIIAQEIRRAWQDALGKTGGGLKTVYDVAHNVAKVEEHEVGGKKIKLIVHRKGATRSFPNQPVIIPGSMGTRSYLLIGQEKALEESFGSTCHGAGRRMSRKQALRSISAVELKRRLEQKGIILNTGSVSGLAEEAPEAYKDIDRVVEVVDKLGIAKKIACFKPVIVIKG